MSVSISEGATALTVIPSLTRRAAYPQVNPSRPAFDALQCGPIAPAPRAAPEEILTIRPHFLARIIGKTARVHKKTDFRLVPIVLSKSASERSSIPRVIAMPALLINMSIVSSSELTASTILVTASPCETSA
jgi:hypothetical protein